MESRTKRYAFQLAREKRNINLWVPKWAIASTVNCQLRLIGSVGVPPEFVGGLYE